MHREPDIRNGLHKIAQPTKHDIEDDCDKDRENDLHAHTLEVLKSPGKTQVNGQEKGYNAVDDSTSHIDLRSIKEQLFSILYIKPTKMSIFRHT
jgi:hypothetical protein